MQAVILAAGVGRRLGALTRHSTKFMLPFNGRPLGAPMLEALAAAGIDRVVLVVGHAADEVRDFVGDRYLGMAIDYVDNPDYAQTNNIHSLLLARDYLQVSDSLVLESDIVCDPAIVAECVAATDHDVAVVARFESWMDGTLALLDDAGAVARLVPRQDYRAADRARYFKTVNIYRFSRAFSQQQLVPFLERYVAEHGTGAFYEQVLQVLVATGGLHLATIDAGSRRWYEIDDIQDLDIAETLFATDDDRPRRLGQRFGGYWRFSQIEDFVYLVNPFFPPRRLLDDLAHDLPVLVGAYPSGQWIQRQLASRLFGCEPRRFLVGNGASELMAALFAEIGGSIVVPRPTFEEYPRLAGDRRVDVPQVPPGFPYRRAELVEACRGYGAEALVLVNPANPTGQFISSADVLELVEELNGTGIRLLLDESFVDFVDGSAAHSLLRDDVFERYPNLVVVRSLGKSHGVAGLRLGVLASGDGELLARVERRLPIWNVNSVAECFMQRAPLYQNEYAAACLQVVSERNRLQAGLDEVGWLRPLSSSGNFVLCELGRGISAAAVTRALLAGASILVKDCSGRPGLEGGQYVRLAVRGPASNDRLLRALAELDLNDLGA